MNVQHTTEETQARRKKRAVIARFALAGVAVLGIGAAATSAAWTDDAWFSASADAAKVELQASLDGSSWIDADSSGAAAVTIPAATFANMVPGQIRTVTLHLKNTSTVQLAISTLVVNPTGDMFTGATPATAAVTGAPATLAAGADTLTAPITLTVTAPPAWPATYQGKTGSVTIHFQGQTTA